MNILVAVEELRFGGAQTFALRLAQALHEAGHRVYLYTLYGNLTEPGLVQRLAPGVPVLAYAPGWAGADHFVQRAEGWLERRGRRPGWRQRVLSRHLRECLLKYEIDVISSNTFKSDELMAFTLAHSPALRKVPLVVTMHGDYEQFWDAYLQPGGEQIIADYRARLARTVAHITGIAYLADQNLRVLAPDIVPATATRQLQTKRIYNGLEGRFSAEKDKYSRVALGIGGTDLVFGMVARGVPEKGWESVVQAYQQLRATPGLDRPVHLVLVGASPHLTELQQRYGNDPQLHFLGFVNNPVDCVEAFDVGILASALMESLPNSIAEYLFCGKPAISTEVGEIRNMLRPVLNVDEAPTPGEELAGQLVPFPASGQATDPGPLFAAMHRYATDPALLARHQELARLAFCKFDMAQCVAAYVTLYHSCREQRAAG